MRQGAADFKVVRAFATEDQLTSVRQTKTGFWERREPTFMMPSIIPRGTDICRHPRTVARAHHAALWDTIAVLRVSPSRAADSSDTPAHASQPRAAARVESQQMQSTAWLSFAFQSCLGHSGWMHPITARAVQGRTAPVSSSSAQRSGESHSLGA